MIAVLRSLRKLVLGETWALPIGVGVAVGTAAALSALVDDGLWEHGGGFALLALVLTALAVSLR